MTMSSSSSSSSPSSSLSFFEPGEKALELIDSSSITKRWKLKRSLRRARTNPSLQELELAFVELEPATTDLLIQLLKTRQWNHVRFYFCKLDRLRESKREELMRALGSHVLHICFERTNHEGSLQSLLGDTSARVKKLSLYFAQPSMDKSFQDGLFTNQSLQELDIRQLPETTTPNFSEYLVQGLQKHPALQKLTIDNTNMSDSELASLLLVLQDLPSLTDLTMVGDCETQSLATLSSLLAKPRTSLQTLRLNTRDPAYFYVDRLSRRCLPDVFVLTEGLRCNSTLVHCDLSYNFLTDQDISLLAKPLSTVHTLQQLNLSHNCIGNKGLQHLAQHLPDMIQLKYLLLMGNASIGVTGMSSILNVLKRYHNLRLEWIPGPDELQEGIPYYDCTTVQELVVYTNLNRCGRHLLLEDDLSFARSVWSHVVARANRILYPDMIPHVLFHLIQESINIWTAPSPPPLSGL